MTITFTEVCLQQSKAVECAMNRLPLSSINFPRNTYFVTFLRVMNLSATDLALPCLCILSCFAWKQLVPFNYGHNITIYILFLDLVQLGFFLLFLMGYLSFFSICTLLMTKSMRVLSQNITHIGRKYFLLQYTELTHCPALVQVSQHSKHVRITTHTCTNMDNE